MFRVGRSCPIAVVAPVPWFPLQALLRRWRPGFRPDLPRYEVHDSVEVYRPRFLSVPGMFKFFDGLSMALSSWPTLRRLRRSFEFSVIDAHFAYPEGYAATLLGNWIGVPVTVTLRGTEVPLARDPRRRHRILKALENADAIFSVSDSLKQQAVDMGIEGSKIKVIPNGVDSERFRPVAKALARQKLGLPLDARILISVGALVERKGFHRVIEVLPRLSDHYPRLHYLVVGGASPEGNCEQTLRRQTEALGLEGRVHFTGSVLPDELKTFLSAADVFVLSTRNEGWANVFLEAMACGLPIVTTKVGGNAEVVSSEELGLIVPFGDPVALEQALQTALERKWNHAAIIAYARSNSWAARVDELVGAFSELVTKAASRDAIAVQR